ncbi:ABC transporter ATP-binding protein [Agromyces protaetiae]|uniref:ABC transporter ATP-binding protein n=1 Tax=Agromyces protaetiae TaxID=2509455 RepID=A0A4V0YH99_9MICO|nr:ABC transporter ATP-binding protein [Agromyces protaetiae]QAY73971.1 ABC transporter ATP-binding protein [Agromyces protaetiae]
MSLVDVRNLRIAFGGVEVVHGISFAVEPGRCVALVGESGSGKSLSARALLGLAGRGAAVSADRLVVDGVDVLEASERRLRGLRGSRVGLVLQDALTSLDPLRPIGREIDDAVRLHTGESRDARRARVLEALARVGMPDPADRVGSLSGELSGGLRQRALIASAVVLDPPFVIADEPTTALDTGVQRRVLEELSRLKRAGTGILLISHDLGIVAEIADRVHVLKAGGVIESGETATVLAAPATEYTRRLIGASPAGVPRGRRLLGTSGAPLAQRTRTERPVPPVLALTGVTKSFAGRSGKRIAVDDVSLELAAGETLAVIGESGSGKSTIARLVLGLTAPDSGAVELFGEPWSASPERARRARRPRIGFVAQDTRSAFDPRLTVAASLADALPTSVARSPRAARRARIGELLDAVGLDSAFATRRPDSLSGGERQRLAIARALARESEVLVLDEPVSALDVTVQARVLDLLDDLQQERGLAYLFITHDLDVAAHMSDRIVVLCDGRIVEQGPTTAVLGSPADAYTAALVADAPRAIRSSRS